MRQPVIGIMDRDLIAVDKIGRKDRQIGATGVTQRRKQDAAKSGGDDQVRELPRWRDFLVDASDLAPGTIPFLPSAVPDIRVEPLRKVGHLGERDLVGGKGGRRGDAGALLVFLKSRLGRTGQVKRFDAGPVETTAVDRRACTAGGQEGPFGCQERWKISSGPTRVTFTRAPRSRDPG